MIDRHSFHPFLAAALLLLTIGCGTLQSRWEETRAADSIAAYEAFLQEHPQGEQAPEARERLAGLQAQRDWEAATRQDSVAAYRDFLAKHPAGTLAEMAQARIRTLAPPSEESLPGADQFIGAFLKRHEHPLFRIDNPAEREALAFEETVRKGTIPAYETFLRQYPAGERTAEARGQLEALFFKQAQAEDTVEAYERYLQRYPQGTFAIEARVQRKELAGWIFLMPRTTSNIRAARTTNSGIKGQLRPGDRIKAGFLRNGWYAVFPLAEKERREEKALGYVHASLLIPVAESSERTRAPGMEGQETLPGSPGDGAPELPVTVLNIQFQAAGDGQESLRIVFDRPYLPTLSGIEGKTPKILIELRHSHPIPPQWTNLDTNGRFIRRILGETDRKAKTARIVLEMDPGRNYAVNPVFYEQDNAYVLEITEAK